MPHIVIDGVRVEAASGDTVIKAAYDNGMQITHFCWHPELSISGNCRMCLVEVGFPKKLQDGTYEKDSQGKPVVNYFPKLQIACATIVSEDMYILTKSEKVIAAQEAVMEFLLINHPLDCPICDEAGQCKLQEYAFMHSRAESRFEEMKNRKDKRQDWGPNVLFDAERCISCSRCIRFAQEIAHQDVLTFVGRGDHVTIKLFDGTQFDNPYSMNVIDICPVGALTSKDFRFKARVWDMSFNDSICPGCARGCNTKLGVRNNEVLRVEPQTNMNVNKYWMCDYGRLSQLEPVNHNRVISPMIRKDGELVECLWEEAYFEVAEKLKSVEPHNILFIGSHYSTTEDNYLLLKFTRDVIKTENRITLNHIDFSFADDFLRCSDMTPNATGVNVIQFDNLSNEFIISEIINKIETGKLKVLYVMNEDFNDYSELLNSLSKLEFLIVHSTNFSKLTELASIVLSSSTFAESEGTFVNIDRIVQHFTPALVTKENMRIMGMKMSRLDKFGAMNDRWTHHEIRNCRPNWKIIQGMAKYFSVEWNYKSVSDIFKEISEVYEVFRGMSYELLDEFQGLILGGVELPEKKEFVYKSHVMKPN